MLPSPVPVYLSLERVDVDAETIVSCSTTSEQRYSKLLYTWTWGHAHMRHACSKTQYEEQGGRFRVVGAAFG